MDSQKQQILNDLLTGVRLTAIDALNRYGCNRLAARISDLHKDGFNIQRKMIEVETRNGKTKVAQYWIEPEVKPKVSVDYLGQTALFI